MLLFPGAKTSLLSAGEEILASVAALKAADPKAHPVAFWDFDGTLFEGDCSEGFTALNQEVVPGFVECAVNAGWSRMYPSAGGFARCWEDYQQITVRDGVEAAYTYFVRIFAGAPAAALQEMAEREFAGRLRPWFFQGAMELWQQLEAGGVGCMVISASADFFVKGAAGVLGVPASRLHGLRLIIGDDGILTDQPADPVTVGTGKATLLQKLLDDPRVLAGNCYPIAAFGNDIVSDGPMLKAVASATLPAGTPFAGLVNARGPAPAPAYLRDLTFTRRFSS